MLRLNLGNVEELIFHDRLVQAALPDRWFSTFEQWRLAVRHPFLREMGRKAILDFLNGLDDIDQSAMQEHFGEEIEVERLNYNVTFNCKAPLDGSLCDVLCAAEGWPNVSVWRDRSHLYLSFWR